MVATAKLAVVTGLATLMGLSGVTGAHAAESDTAKAGATIPVTVTFTNVRMGDVPFYVSIQNEADYQSIKGHGAIHKTTDASTFTRTYDIPTEGDYAVTVWHDLDNDGRFSMTDTYQILDGWGTSGTVPRGTSPSFDDAMVAVSSYGANVEIEMMYPDS